MRKFYQSTYYFWIVSKLLIAVGGIISSFGNLADFEYLRGEEKLANFIGFLYSILLIADVVLAFNGKYYKSVKYTTGTISMIIGLVLAILMSYMNVISIPLTLAFIAWIILLGFFDYLIIKRRVEAPERGRYYYNSIA